MDSWMVILTEVQFMHGYFRDGRCRCLSVAPADSSLRDMMRYGLLLKSTSGGFRLLYDSNHAGSPRSRSEVLYQGITIRILLQLEDTDFYNYTSPLSIDPGRQVLYFCNRPGRPFLHTEEQVSGSDVFETTAPCRRPGRKIVVEPSAQRPFARPFAILDLRLYPGLGNNYHIFFQTRSTRWNYILVGDHLKELHDPAILLQPDKKQAVNSPSAQASNGSSPKVFSGPSTIRLRDNRTGLSFISPAPVEVRETPAATCTLVEDFDQTTGKYKVVIATLPVPDGRIISRANTHNKQPDLSEIILY